MRVSALELRVALFAEFADRGFEPTQAAAR